MGGRGGRPLLRERRELAWRLADERAWWLAIGFSLTPVGRRSRPAGEPGLGRAHRVPATADSSGASRPMTGVDVRTPDGCGERATHGRVAPWLAWSATAAGGDFTVVAAPGDARTAADPWFVRVRGYPGFGSALAWDAPVLARRRAASEFSVADGRLTDGEVAAYASS